MNDREFHERLNELGHSWQGGIASEEDPAETEAREQRHVRAIGDAIVRASEGRRRERAFQRVYVALAAAAVLAALFVAGRALLRPVPSVAPVTAKAEPAVSQRGVRSLSGEVTLQHAGAERVVREAELVVGDALAVSDSGQAEVRLGGVVRANALGSSHVVVVAEGTRSAHRLRLDGGRIEARVDDRPSAKPKLVVETPDVEVVVTGTVFNVDVARNERGASITRVSVEKGRVVIFREGKEVAVVTSGTSWASETDEAPPVPEPASSAAKPSRNEARRQATREVTRLPSSGTLDDVAVGTLGEENTLFQTAIDARNRGDHATVADRLGQLISRFPRSPLAGEARVERMRALARMGRTEAAAREARRYLAAYPEGFARDEAKRLVLSGATP